MQDEIAESIRGAGLRATKQRIFIYAQLKRSQYPASALEIAEALPRGTADTATVYRILEQFGSAGLVRQTDTRTGAMVFELADRPHHHHIVCSSCGDMEDVGGEIENGLEKRAVRHAKKFSRIDSHSLEFFGTCNACSR